MIHGAVPSLSLINNETNSKEKTLRYKLQLGYLSHYYSEREKILSNTLKVIWRTEICHGMRFIINYLPIVFHWATDKSELQQGELQISSTRLEQIDISFLAQGHFSRANSCQNQTS